MYGATPLGRTTRHGHDSRPTTFLPHNVVTQHIPSNVPVFTATPQVGSSLDPTAMRTANVPPVVNNFIFQNNSVSPNAAVAQFSHVGSSPSSHTFPQAAQAHQPNYYSTTPPATITPRAQIGGNAFIPAQTGAQVPAPSVPFKTDLSTKIDVALRTFMGIIAAETHVIVGRAENVPIFLKDVLKHARTNPLSPEQMSLVASLIAHTRRICIQYSLSTEQLDSYYFAS